MPISELGNIWNMINERNEEEEAAREVTTEDEIRQMFSLDDDNEADPEVPPLEFDGIGLTTRQFNRAEIQGSALNVDMIDGQHANQFLRREDLEVQTSDGDFWSRMGRDDSTSDLTVNGNITATGSITAFGTSSALARITSIDFKVLKIINKETDEFMKININNYDEVIEYIYKVKEENIIVRTETIETSQYSEGGNLTLEKEKEIVQTILNVLNKKERRSIGDMLDRD